MIRFHARAFRSKMVVMSDLKIKCPHCRKPVAWDGNRYRPFCSEKCRQIDLGNWANENYAIDGGQAPQPDDEQPSF